MIQRIQSLYFFLAALLLGLLVFAPIYSLQEGQTQYKIYIGGLQREQPAEVLVSQPGVLAVSVILALLCLVAILLYKHRKIQKTLSSSLMISSAAYVILLAASATELVKRVPGYKGEGSYEWGLALPFFAIAFLLLAGRGIKKDEELIKSADRLR